MKIDRANKLQFFTELYADAKSLKNNVTAQFEKNYKQYLGRTDEDMQKNITYELVETQISTNIPYPSVTPVEYSEGNQRNARSIERICERTLDGLQFERLNDRNERHTYIYGTSIFLVEWDESIRTENEVGNIVVKSISPEDFFPQPGINAIEDAEYMFVRFTCTTYDLVRKYGVSEDVAESAGKDSDSDTENTKDICDVIVCFYKDENDNICRYVFSQGIELSDVEDYYSRKRCYCRKCRQSKELCVCENPDFTEENAEFEELDEDKVTDSFFNDGSVKVIPAMSPKYKDGKPVIKGKIEKGVEYVNGIPIPREESEDAEMIPTKIPYYKPKTFPIIVRNNISAKEGIWGISDCETIEPQQTEINKVYDKIHNKVKMSGAYPYKPEKLSFKMDNSVGVKVLNLPPDVSAGQIGTLDISYDFSRDLYYAEQLYADARRILGITDSYQGFADTTAKSGKAKQIQVERSAGRLESKRVLKGAFYSDMFRVIFELYLAFADEPRNISFKDGFGSVQNAHFNKYDFVEFDKDTGEWYYDDRYLFSTDKNSLNKQDDSARWEYIRADYQIGLFGQVGSVDAILCYWRKMAEANYVGANSMVDYFTQMKTAMQAQTQTGDYVNGEMGVV